MRFPLSGATRYGGTGQGSGGCNDDLGQNGQDWFNNAAINHITCALEWGPGILDFHCWDGLYTIATIGAAAVSIGFVAGVCGRVVRREGSAGTCYVRDLWECNGGGREVGVLTMTRLIILRTPPPPSSSPPSSQGHLIASYQYPIPGNVPPPGTERWHFNLW